MEKLKKKALINNIFRTINLIIITIMVLLIYVIGNVDMIATPSPENTAGVGDWAALGRFIGWAFLLYIGIPAVIICIILWVANIDLIKRYNSDNYILYIVLTNIAYIIMEIPLIGGAVTNILFAETKNLKVICVFLVVTILKVLEFIICKQIVKIKAELKKELEKNNKNIIDPDDVKFETNNVE